MSNESYIERFKELYPEVIDENGSIKVCGREKCKELIKLAHFITGKLNTYGDHNTGCLNRDKIIELYTILSK